MNKTPSLFARDFAKPGNPLTTDFSPGVEWVLEGMGTPTRKYDGTCVMLDNAGRWWARREVKPGKTAPPNFQYTDEDDVTGKVMGWEPIEQSGWHKHFQDALHPEHDVPVTNWLPGTYELCGPKVNGNPEGYLEHILIRHAAADRLDRMFPTLAATLNELGSVTDDQLRFEDVKSAVTWLNEKAGWEGIVWHHPNGDYVKIKARDFKR